jgi:hypothetical protein
MSIQDRRDLAQADRLGAEARLILTEASALGIRISTDGDDLVMLASVRVPGETRRGFERKLEEHRAEVINLIMAEAAS